MKLQLSGNLLGQTLIFHSIVSGQRQLLVGFRRPRLFHSAMPNQTSRDAVFENLHTRVRGQTAESGCVTQGEPTHWLFDLKGSGRMLTCFRILVLFAVCCRDWQHASSCYAAVRVLLVGVNQQDDHDIPSVPQAATDVEELRVALQQSGIQDGMNGAVVRCLYSRPIEGALLPTRANIVQVLTEESRAAAAEDVLIFYFTGHAIEYQNQAALVPSDAGIIEHGQLRSILLLSELKEALERSRARHKIVIIDSCYSGSFASFDPLAPVAQAFAGSNLYAITASSDSELSVVWPSRQQSLATRWLCHGLRGGADRDLDGTVSMDELFGFVERNVSRTFPLVLAEINSESADGQILLKRNQKSQTPQRMIGPPWNDPRLFEMQPHTARQAIQSLAEQLADRIAVAASRQSSDVAPRIAVLPSVSKIGMDVIRGKYPVLEQLMAPELTQALIDAGRGSFEMLSPRSVEAATKSFQIRSLDTQRRSAFQQLRTSLQDEVDFFVHTRIFVRENHLILSAELLSSSGGAVAYETSLVVELSPDLISSLVEESWFRPSGKEESSLADAGKVSKRTQATHSGESSIPPLQKPAAQDISQFPVNVTFQVADEAIDSPWKDANLDPGGLSFRVQRGQKLRLRVKNTTDRHLAAVVYVDGINILGRKPQTPVDALTNSGFWILEPHTQSGFSGWYQRISSGSDQTNSQPTARFDQHAFVVTDAPRSLAAQLSYSENIGDIRIYLYETRAQDPQAGLSTRSVGIGSGQKQEQTLKTSRLSADGHRPLGTLVFKYAQQ